MGTIFDLDLTGLIKEKSGAPKGDAHELYCRSILMRLGFEVGKADLSASSYDVFLMAFENFPTNKNKILLRVQCKTISSNSIPLKSGGRGGVDRKYISDVKNKKITKEDCDLILAVDDKSLDIYILPSIFFLLYNTSVSKNKIKHLKNNWDLFLNWNESYISDLQKFLTPPSRRPPSI